MTHRRLLTSAWWDALACTPLERRKKKKKKGQSQHQQWSEATRTARQTINSTINDRGTVTFSTRHEFCLLNLTKVGMAVGGMALTHCTLGSLTKKLCFSLLSEAALQTNCILKALVHRLILHFISVISVNITYLYQQRHYTGNFSGILVQESKICYRT